MRTMRSAVFLLACMGANAALSDVNDPPSCAIDSSKAVNEMLDSALFIWAAIERCGKTGDKGEMVCAIDVSNVIKSVSAIIKFIIKTVDECSTIKSINHACAASSFELTEAIGGLTGASVAIADKCPAKAPAPAPEPTPAPTPVPSDPCAPGSPRKLGAPQSSRRLSDSHFRAATCAIEVKSSMKAIAKAVVNIMEVQKTCGDSTNWDCTNSGISLVSAFASMATYIMGAAGHCSRIQFDLGIGCASAVTDIIGKLLDVSKAANSIHTECAAAPKPTVLVPTPTPIPGPPPTVLVPTPVPTPLPPPPTVLVPTPVPTPMTAQPTILVPTPVPTPIAQPTVLVPTPVPTPVNGTRLYAKDGASNNVAFANALKENGPATFTLAALLPITGIAAYLGGSRFSRNRASQSGEYQLARETIVSLD